MPDTAIELEFGNGRYRFWLPMDKLVALERDTRSVLSMYADLIPAFGLDGDGKVVLAGGSNVTAKEIAAIIRAGLEGGGEGVVDAEPVAVTPIRAGEIVRDYVHSRPLAETVPVAFAILGAAVNGVDLKKKGAGGVGPAKAKASRKAKS